MKSSTILEQLNKKYGTSNKKELALKMLKENGVKAGEAVVNVIATTGIAGFKFHIPESEMVRFENEITDHYVDTGTAIQDHIVQKPITITLNGYIGDYFYSIHKIEDMVALITPTITLVKEYLPQVARTLGIKLGKQQNPELKLIQLPGGPQAPVSGNVEKHKFNLMDLYKLFQNLYKMKSAQARAFLYFECLWKSRSLFSVETTWKRYDNMAIQSIQAKRDNNADITEFSVTFKQITFANTLTIPTAEYTNYMNNETADLENSNRYEQEIGEFADKGVENGKEVGIEEGLSDGVIQGRLEYVYYGE